MAYKDPERRREAHRRWLAANPEKARERREKERQRRAAWRAANPEKAREEVRRWRAANPEKMNSQSRRWRAANPEKARLGVRVRARRRRDRDLEHTREKNREKNRRWRAANPERVNGQACQWRTLNRGRMRELRQRRKNKITEQTWKQIAEAARSTRKKPKKGSRK